MSKFAVDGPRPNAERLAAALLAAVAVLLGVAGYALANHQQSAARSRLLPRPAQAAISAGSSINGTAVALPVRVSIPAIGVAASIVTLGLDSAGALIPPSSANNVGWYAGGPAPGAIGPAVLAGHVDSKVGPAVFWRLRELLPGDLVSVTSADGQVRRFAVTAVQKYPKNAFPTAAVYGNQDAVALRLITCGGTYDSATHSYRDNVVVYATELRAG